MSFATGLKRTFLNADYATIGDLTATNLNVLENARVGIDLAVIHDATVGNDVSIGHDLFVDHDAGVGHDVSIGHDLSVAHDATIDVDAFVGNDLSVTHNITAGDDVTATQFLQRAQPSLTPYLLVPTGSVLQFVGAAAPGGWVLCDGSAISRSDYSTLFGVIGTTFGVGDGSTTFNVPDFRGRVALGAGAGSGLTVRTLGTASGQESITQVPPHTHTITDPGHTHTYYGVNSQGVASGLDNAAENSPRPVETSGGSVTGISVNNTGTNIAAGAVNTMNPFLVVSYIIKV